MPLMRNGGTYKKSLTYIGWQLLMVWKGQMACEHWWAKPFIIHVAAAIHTRVHNAFQLPTNLLTTLMQCTTHRAGSTT